MTDAQLPIQFGLNIDPAADHPEDAFRRALVADQYGLDLISIQDHPYNANHLETWTLLTALSQATERVRLVTNVLNTPLRPPAVLAKQAATLDVLSGGRLEVGLGAGAYPPGIQAFGGPKWGSPERFRAFKEYVDVILTLWENAGRSQTYEGEFYQLKGARLGPRPQNPIRLWFGATGPQMLRFTGETADGLLISNSYVPVDRLPEINRRLDEGAESAQRDPTAVRRGYNLMGMIDLKRTDTRPEEPKENYLYGPPSHWAAEIERLYARHRMDTFVFWPVGGNEFIQVEAFAEEVVPEVRKRLNQGREETGGSETGG